MSQQAITPTLIDTIFEACRQVRDGRNHRNVALHAVTELGELAQEIEIATGRPRGKVAGEDGIAGEALDLILCIVDFLHQLDARTSDRSIMEAMNAREAAKGVSYASFALYGWSGWRPIEPERMAEMVMSMTEDLGQLYKFDAAPFGEEPCNPLYPAAHVVSDCLQLIRTVKPGITEAELIAMAQVKLAKWKGGAVPGETLLMEGEA